MTLRAKRGARVAAAAAALGLWAAGPYAIAVAVADGGDDGAWVSAGSDSARGQPDARPGAQQRRQPVQRAGGESVTVPLRSAMPRSAAAVGAVRSPAGSRAGATAPVTAPGASSVRARGTSLPTKTAATSMPAVMGPAAPTAETARPEPAAVDDVATEPLRAVSAPLAVVPVAAPTGRAVVPAGSLRASFLNFVDGGLTWLSGLPTSPVADFLSGAMLLIRRSVADVPALPGQVTATSTESGQTTLVVTTLADAGPGSLRQAILDANASGGNDQITFAVTGAIRVAGTPLPTILDTVVIDGTTAPGYAGAPVVRIDFENTAGLMLAEGASDSQILSLSLVDAAGTAVTIAASETILNGNYIGVWGDGRTVEANRGDGVLILAGADGNLVGSLSPWTFVLGNVISGNRGNGVTIAGGTGNAVIANYIGTDSTGSIALGNRGNGIQLTNGATGNAIGGKESGGNDPTNGVYIRPPQGNLISGNYANGVLIDGRATQNGLSGNYIGTDATGNAPLGNRGDGVSVVGADGNLLIGTTSLQNPFVYYNVISGNDGNGLHITDSDHTVVHANFFGAGANNTTAVPNRGDGMLVEGDSRYVDAGGEISLGNVMSGNNRNGIEIRGTASGVVSVNNFVGQAASGGVMPNRLAGISITSSNPHFDPGDSGTWNRIRTSLIGGNYGNGIEFLGNARGVEITDTAVGTTSDVRVAIPNLGNGIVVAGNSNNIAIGGFQPSVGQAGRNFSVYSSGNKGYGIVFAEHAHDITVFDTRVGLGDGAELDTASKLPNGKGGILIGCGTDNIQIGGQRDAVNPGWRYFNEIVGNTGDGVRAEHSTNLKLLGNTISGNAGSGVVLNDTTGAVVGAPLAGNVITKNGGSGIYASGRLTGSVVQSSTISNNGSTGVRMSCARGLAVGGTDLIRLNTITGNDGWGILATGWSRRSAILGNNISGNADGNVNTTFAWGMNVAPPSVSE